MADRKTKVTLSVQMQQYIDGMQKAAQATRETGTESEKLAQKKEAFDLLGKTALIAGGAMAAGLGVAVAKFAEFDQAMSNVQAATHESSENMELLRQASLDAGASTVFSATESANAVEELAKAGISTADILSGALAGSLDLAAAGELGVARAAEIAATTLQQFGLEGSEAGHVADVLAAGAGKAMGSVEDLAQGMKFVGPIAASMGVSLEETAGTLALFAQQGIIGEQAGTSLRGMLSSLTSPSAQARKELEALGIQLYDAEGNFMGLQNAAGQMSKAYAGMTGEARDASLGILFGNQQITAATALYQAGAEGVGEWTDAVNDSGYAAETAAIKLDNLAGDWEALGGAADTALITMGEAADGPLRALVQGLTGVIDKFNELPEGAQQAVFWVGAVGSAGALAFGSYLTLVPKMAEFKRSLDVLGPSAATASRHIGTIAKLGGGALVGFTAAAAGGMLLQDFLRSLGQESEVTANKVKMAQSAVMLFDGTAANLTGQSNVKIAAEQVRGLGDTLDGLRTQLGPNTLVTVEKLGSELGKLAANDLPAAQGQFRMLAEEAGLSEAQQSKLLDRMGPYKKALTEVATEQNRSVDAQSLLTMALGDGSSATEVQTESLEELQGVARNTETDVNALADAIRGFGSAQFDTERATIAFYDAFAGLDSILKDGKGSLDVTTEAGRSTRSAMLDAAQSTNDWAASVAFMGGTTAEVQAVLEDGRQRIINTRIALGDTEEAAREYADQLVSTPATVATQVQLNGLADAANRMNEFVRTYDGRTVTLKLNADASQLNGRVYGGLVNRGEGRADGGAIYGPGGPREDKVGPFWLSPGEHILDAGDVDKMGGQHAVYAFREGLHSGGSTTAAAASFSLDGGHITGSLVIGGDGLARIVDGRISLAENKRAVTASTSRRAGA